MKRITLIAFLCAIVFSLTAQNFHYRSNLAYDVSINDAVELTGKFYLVGSIDSSGTDKPYFCIINNQGAMIFDTIYNSSGKFINIHEVNNVLHISHYSEPFSGYHANFNLQFDTSFTFQNGAYISDGIIQKSKLINDSLIFYIGYEPPAFPNHVYTSLVAKQNVITGNFTYNFPSFSVNPMEIYDIISPSAGRYHLYLNSADSSIADQLSVLYLNDSLQVYKTLQLNSSYRLFGTDSTIRGTASAEYKDGIIHMNCIADHPSYMNQINSLDLALVQFDTNYNELSISFSGKADTNYTTSRNSIAFNNNSLYTGGTGENEIILNQYDTSNNLRFAFYHDASNLELKKIVAFKDSILIIGDIGNQFFIIKLDSIPTQIITDLDEQNIFQSSQFKIYPNPAENYIRFNSDDIKIKRLEFYNQNGTLMKEINEMPFSTTINIQDLKAGVYFLRFITEQNKIHSIIFIKT